MKLKLSFVFILILGVARGQVQKEPMETGQVRLERSASKIGLSKDDGNGVRYRIVWNKPVTRKGSSSERVGFLTFEGARHSSDNSTLPIFDIKKEVYGNPKSVEARIVDQVFVPLTVDEENAISSKKNVGNEFTVDVSRVTSQKQEFAFCSITPIRFNDISGTYEKLIGFDVEWEISTEKKGGGSPVIYTYADHSVLASGNWYKIGIVESGVYKLTYAELADLGLDLDNLDPRNISIFGNGGGMLPMQNAVFRYDDLEQNSIKVIGENDGVFNTSDYILFYGESQEKWSNNGEEFSHQKNVFCDTTYYFLNVGSSVGKRMDILPSLSSYDVAITSFDERLFHEEDKVNLIKTGQGWYGEGFGIINSREFTFQLPNIDPSKDIHVGISMVSHSPNVSSDISVNVNNIIVSDKDNSVSTGYTAIYATRTDIELDVPANSPNVNVEINFEKGSGPALAWLDDIEINARRYLNMSGSQMHFRDLASVGTAISGQFRLENAEIDAEIWDVTDPINPKIQDVERVGTSLIFNADITALHEYVALDGDFYKEVVSMKSIVQQDLHALKFHHPDYIVVTNPKFLSQAEELAQFHRDQEGLTAVVVTTTQIYNEFSSGAQDINAIRGFVKMFYDEAANEEELPKYLLLFGDGSYDYKNRISGNSNYVPVYQSINSFSPTDSYCSDDFYGLLDDNEGQGNNEALDIGIGRLPVRTVEQAQNQVNKIKRYYKEETMRPWRNWLLFIGDDEDGDTHMRDVDGVANRAAQVNPHMNIDKIYLDAYAQVAGAGGERYPEAKEAFNRKIDQGSLIVSYMGHGGELGWAHERILEVPQINAWTNAKAMPLFLTATCEFSRYDDPQRTSAGEYVLLNPDGGAIALLTTTRLVFSLGNSYLMDNFFEFGFSQLDSGMSTLGDLVFATKQNTNSDENSRKFNLLGDPALTLAIPKYNVETTQVPDTMKGLSRVTIKGFVSDNSGQKMDDFNGVIYPSVFDKSKEIVTLHNDNPSDTNYFRFDLQTGIIFKGRASVINGDFEFSFVVPKDIELTYDNARISYYAENGAVDAAGSTTDFLLGGYDENAAEDNIAPEVDLYMNDEAFVFGGLTDENPTMIAHVFDENGINTSGNGVGHDLVAVLDENTTNSIILNDYYEAELDDYQRGKIRYPFSELESGRHNLTLKVWDVYNNSGETNTEFVVAESAKLALDHVLNYPNPFTTNTAFYFEHNQPGQGLDVKIEIFTVSGRLIKTLNTFVGENSYRVGPIYWNGLDDFGDPIGKGVYIYKLKVAVPTGESVDYFEKLVILN